MSLYLFMSIKPAYSMYHLHKPSLHLTCHYGVSVSLHHGMGWQNTQIYLISELLEYINKKAVNTNLLSVICLDDQKVFEGL